MFQKMNIRIFQYLKNRIRAIKKMLSNFNILASRYGQWNSITKRIPIDENNAELPWYTYPAIEYLNSFVFTSCNLFEFGSGNSSIYWAKRVERIVSVEHNKLWFETINHKRMPNQFIILATEEASYTNALAAQSKTFDIIIIDGDWRLQCTLEAIKYIKPSGMILLDNSDRTIEKQCSELLRKNDFIQIDFSGFGPINNYCWTTSIFIKAGCQLQNEFLGPSPIGGLEKR